MSTRKRASPKEFPANPSESPEDIASSAATQAAPPNSFFANKMSSPSHKLKLSEEGIRARSERGIGEECSQLHTDRYSIALLLFLYVLQGIPLGLAGAIPLILQSRKISYSEQAMFSLVYWPFSLKLIWAPIVDAVYSSRIGRRKSWMVPTQYMIGFFMLYLSTRVSYLLGDEDPSVEPSVLILTTIFFMLNFLAATQDVAVDGWALTMLSRENVGYASTCNSVGQTAGFFLGNVLLLALESADFCNQYLRSEPLPHGIVTLKSFLFFWGIVFLITTTLVFIFKTETPHVPGEDEEDESDGVVLAYRQLFKIINLKSVKAFSIILLTVRLGTAATDAVTTLKLIEAGIPKERLALLAVPMVPLQITLPWLISKYTAGPRPLTVFIKALPFRIVSGVFFAYYVYWTPSQKLEDGSFPVYYYIGLIMLFAFNQIAVYSMYVAIMSMHARVSDPAMGGTYMTLLNTVTNLGGNWPSTMMLYLVDPLTWKSCLGASQSGLRCDDHHMEEQCEAAGGTCHTDIDGFYVQTIFCTIFGFIWLKLRSAEVRRIQELPEGDWKVRSTSS